MDRERNSAWRLLDTINRFTFTLIAGAVLIPISTFSADYNLGKLAKDKKIEDWSSWTPAIKRSRRRGRKKEWGKGFKIEFVPSFAPAPIRAKVLEYEEGRKLAWGLRLPGTSVVHRFDFEPLDDGARCRVRQREWADGIMGLLMRPLATSIEKFDRKMGNDLQAHFAGAAKAS